MEFMDAFRNAKKETFRLELLDKYVVDSEKKSFDAYKRGQLKDSDLEEDTKEWSGKLEKLHSKGIKTRRVHVVSLPLSEYLRYEILCYYKTGEEVNMFPRQTYLAMKKDFEPKEFWLIDDKILFLVNYDREGSWINFENMEGNLLTKYNKIRGYAPYEPKARRLHPPTSRGYLSPSPQLKSLLCGITLDMSCLCM